MLNPLSTRNKPSSNDKSQSSARFFKKMSTDENERNYMNYMEKITLRTNQSAKNILGLVNLNSLAKPEDKQNKSTKHKKVQPIFLAKGKSANSTSISEKDFKDHKDYKPVKKDSSVRNLKLSASIEFPPLLAKSISQTTVHRKDEGKIKMFEKIGLRKKIEKSDTKVKPKVEQPKINQFRLGKKLGGGRFGNVYLA